MKNRDLKEIIKRIKVKDDKAFEEMYIQLWDVVYYIAYQYLRDSEMAKDITQETFIIIYQKINNLENEMAFNSWMNRIVINLCIDYKRKKSSKELTGDFDYFFDNQMEENIEFLPDALLYDKDKKEILLKNVAELPLAIKEVVLLYYFEEMKIVDISETLQIAVGTVHKRLLNAKKILSKGFKKEQIRNNVVIGPFVLTLLLKENSKVVCLDTIGDAIYQGITKELSLPVKTENTLCANKAIIATVIVLPILITSIVYMGYFFLFFEKDAPVIVEEKTEEKIEKITLEYFVGKDNAEFIENCKPRSQNDYKKELTEIVNNVGAFLQDYYIEPETKIMYMLYYQQKDGHILLLGERYDSDNEQWNLVYQIIDTDYYPLQDIAIKQWFDQIENQ